MIPGHIEAVQPTRLAIFAGEEHAPSTAMAGSFEKIIQQEACHVIVSKSILESHFRTVGGANLESYFRTVGEAKEVLKYDCYHVPATTYFLLFSQKQANQDCFKIATFTKKEASITLQNFITDKLDDSLLSDALPRIFSTPTDNPQNSDTEFIDLALSNMPPLNIIFNGHGSASNPPFTKEGSIAGLTINDFKNTLSFFNTQVATNLIVIVSCFAAGENQQYMEFYKIESGNAIPPLNRKYSLVIQGIQQASTSSYLSEYNQFFQTLETPPHSLAKAITHISANDRWFLEFSGLNYIPQLLVPNTGWVPLINNIPYISSISNTKLAAAHQEGTPYHLKKSFAAVLECDKITTPIEISPFQNPYPNPEKSHSLHNDYETPEWRPHTTLYNHFPIHSIQFKKDDNKLDLKAFNTIEKPYFPLLVSLKQNQFFKTIILNQDTQQGILTFIRDSFLNTQNRTVSRTFFIESLTGYNDISPTLQGMRFKRSAYNKELIKTGQQKIDSDTFDPILHSILENITKNDWDAFLREPATTRLDPLEKALANAHSATLKDLLVSISGGGSDGKGDLLITILFTYNNKSYYLNDNYDQQQSVPSWIFVQNKTDHEYYYQEIFADNPKLNENIQYIKQYPDEPRTLGSFLTTKKVTAHSRTEGDVALHFAQQDLITLQNKLSSLQKKLQMLKASLSKLLLAVQSLL